MHLEVRKGPDLEYFRKMARYANSIKGDNCLDINLFWDFKRGLSPQEELEQAEMLVDTLLTANSFKKLTIGSDGIWSCYLPQAFLDVFVRELGVR